MLDRKLLFIVCLVTLFLIVPAALGQTQDEIRQAQTILKEKGLDPGTSDGVMTQQTRTAIMVFQRQNNLKATGTLNRQTREALGLSSQGSTTGQTGSQSGQTGSTNRGGTTGDMSGGSQAGATGQPGTTTGQGTTGTTGETSSQTTGMTGRHAGQHSKERVREVQTALQGKGLDPGPIDGIMGPKTKSALQQFQQQNNLSVTGRIDQRTLAALNVSGTEGTQAGSTPGTGTTTGKTTGHERKGESSSLGTERDGTRGEESTAKRSGGSMGSMSHSSSRSGHYTPTSQSSTQTMAGSSSTSDEKTHDQAELARKAGIVLNELNQAPDKGIPTELLEHAKGIAVIPSVVKGAFGIGGRWGEGLMAGRNPDGSWGAPSYLEIGGASVGFQIGVSSTDIVLVFTSKDAIDTLLKGKLHLGADAAVAAGPVGRSGSVGTDVKFNGPIYSYSRSKGVFAGVSLEGAVITIDDSANHKVYGENVSGTDILEKHAVQPNAIVQPFMAAVREHTPTMRAE